MSAINRIFRNGEISILNSGHKDILLMVVGRSKGAKLTVLLDEIAVIDPDMELGSDPRMQLVMRILRPHVNIDMNDELTNGNVRFRVIKMDNTEADPSDDFWLEQLTS